MPLAIADAADSGNQHQFELGSYGRALAGGSQRIHAVNRLIKRLKETTPASEVTASAIADADAKILQVVGGSSVSRQSLFHFDWKKYFQLATKT